MTSKEAKIRLSELYKIPIVAQIDHRHLLDDQGDHPLLTNLPRNRRRKIKAQTKKIVKQYHLIMQRNALSGAGYPVDQFLRDLVTEYTHRYASSGTGTQPVSFNYLESFCNVKLIKGSFAPYAEPINEIDNLFSITDYFEYITSKEAEKFSLASLMSLSENVAFHYTSNGDILELTFLNAAGREFVISGFSLVRRRNSLHWYLLGGEICSDEEWTIKCENPRSVDLENIEPSKRAFLSAAINKNGNTIGKPLSLMGTETAVKTIVAGEIDLLSEKYLGRCIMAEYEHSFDIKCDDPDIFLHSLLEADLETRVTTMIEQIEKAPVMWDLVGSMFQLPSYFDKRLKVPEKLVNAAGKKVRPLRYAGGRGLNGEFKKIPSLEVGTAEVPIIQQVNPVYYKTETNGHWRRIKPDSIGKGPDGNDEVGRTWVKSKNPWRETKRVPRTIYVKSTLQSAKLKAEEYLKAAEENDGQRKTLKN